MGFLDGLGRAAGTLYGGLVSMGEQVNKFKTEYRSWPNDRLMNEYKKWKAKSNTEATCRKMAISSILKERGYDVNDL